MKIACWFGLMVLLQVTAAAANITCLDKLLPFSRHSGVHQLSRQEWNDGQSTLNPNAALAAIRSLTEVKLLCNSSEINVVVQPVCNKVIQDQDSSLVCFLFTNLGYFIIAKDGARTTNIIFSRDTRFSSP